MSDIDITGSISNEPTITGQFEPDIVIQGNVDSQFPAQVSVASVTTGDPGTDAAVVNVGTPGNARLQFTIPRGDKGEQGDTGPQGIQGETGPAGADSTVPGPAGADGVVQSLVAGSNITIDATDPANPIINSTASGSGDVVGPASAVDGTPAVYDGTTGKLIKNITYAAFKTLLSLVKGDVGLGNVDNTSDATKNSASATLTNKTLTSPVINSATGSAASSFTATTQSARDNSTKLATTAYVDGATREKLSATRTYYVRTDGSDSNNGLANTSGGAFLTLNKARDVITQLDLAGFVVTIKLGNSGTFGGLNFNVPVLGGRVVIEGDTTTSSNTVITGVSTNCITCAADVDITVQNLRMTNTTSGNCLECDGSNGYIRFGPKLEFGSTPGWHIAASTAGKIDNSGNNYSIVGGAQYHLVCLAQSTITMSSCTVTLTGTPAWTTAFAEVQTLSTVTLGIVTYSGSATGKRYEVIQNSILNTFGAGTASTYFPGNSNGTTATGGIQS